MCICHSIVCISNSIKDLGQPRYNITKQQLEYFLDFGFTATRISAMLGVSEPTTLEHLIYPLLLPHLLSVSTPCLLTSCIQRLSVVEFSGSLQAQL